MPTTYIKTGGSQSIYSANVHTEKLVGTPQEHWQQRLDAISGESVLPMAFAEQDINIQGVLTVAYIANPDENSDLVNMLSQKPVEKSLFVVSVKGKTDKQARISQLVAGLMKGYEPGNGEGFSVGDGVLTTEHGNNENPLDEIKEEKQWLAQDGIDLEVIKNEQHTVNGFEGFEWYV